MLINLKVKTLDAQTHEFEIDNEITVREFKDKIAEKTRIAAEQQRIIYCGRVMADEKQVKEYDVNGKVVHVAERPPPSARGASSVSSQSAGDNAPRLVPSGMRNSPLFRALDGMVVGTMAIPINAGVNPAQMQLNPFTSSSSFCMNRITVARHMLECANNIAAFLEDPSRGLNNSSMDILAQGRWTMESTVVEVGITAGDVPQEQNIVDMLEGAVSAALRRNGNTNVTVVQLPTVFGSSENPDGTQTSSETTALVVEEPMEDALDDSADSAAVNSSTSTEEMETANEDEAPQGEEVAPTVSSGAAATAGTTPATTSVGSSVSGAASASSSNNNAVEQNVPSRRRTGTNVLADVIDQMRSVQNRLNPFIEQFYDMLRNEPTFEENDTAGRGNSQRLYDRVSEAFHYMSHAQHAISDLLLDVSQPAPRYLACRPILVEQSGYVSSNNYLSAAAASGLGNMPGNTRQQPQQQQNQPSQQQSNAQTPQEESQSLTESEAPAAMPAVAAVVVADAPVEDPVDEPVVSPRAANAPIAAAAVEPNGNNAINDDMIGQPTRRPRPVSRRQIQVERLIQAVVNSAPIDAEFHVQINTPNIVSFGLPLDDGTRTTTPQQQEQQNNTQSSAGSNANSNDNNSPTETASASSEETTADSPNQARATTATLPTTATQTRSTSRPHVQIGNLPPSGGWNGRVIPSNMISSFDRFLPCNSHHVRDPENATININGQNAGSPGQIIPNTARVNQRTLRTITDLIRHGPTFVASPPLLGVRSAVATRSAATGATASPRSGSRSSSAPHGTGASSTNSATENHRRVRLRMQLLNFINQHMFEGVPISDNSMELAMNKVIRWLYDLLVFLPQYDLPQYDFRNSIESLLRHSMPLMINVVNSTHLSPTQFEQRLKELCTVFVKRLFSILFVCSGDENAERYWCEIMRALLPHLRSHFRGEALQFLQFYLNTKAPTAMDTNDALQFVVCRNIEESTPEPEADVEMVEIASTSQNALDNGNSDSLNLDPVVNESEEWHSDFPPRWVPCIAQDMQTQREMQSPQGPYSDAYLEGMSSKRRKMIQNSKPTSDIQSMVTESVQQAMRVAGVSTSTASNQSLSSDEITAAIAGDANVQASYCEAVRTSVRDRLKNDVDYKPDRFPQTSKFFNK